MTPRRHGLKRDRSSTWSVRRGWRGWTGSAASRREDLPHKAAEAGDDILAGEFVILAKFARWAVAAEDFDLARFGIDHPDQGHANFSIVIQLFLEFLNPIVG